MINSDRVSYGRNPDLGTWKDNRYIRCRKCGFICHLDRNHRGKVGSREGDGVSYATDVLVDDTRCAVDSANWTSSTITIQNVHTDGYFIGGGDSSISSNSLGYTVSAGLTYMIGAGTLRETVTKGCPLCGCLTYDQGGF